MALGASRRAVASPMPLLAPVISTTLGSAVMRRGSSWRAPGCGEQGPLWIEVVGHRYRDPARFIHDPANLA
jgi:hypothetical protein